MVGAEAHPGFYITQGYKWGLSTSPTGWKMPPFRFSGWPGATHGGRVMMISPIASFSDGAVDIGTEWS